MVVHGQAQNSYLLKVVHNHLRRAALLRCLGIAGGLPFAVAAIPKLAGLRAQQPNCVRGPSPSFPEQYSNPEDGYQHDLHGLMDAADLEHPHRGTMPLQSPS